MRRDQLELDRHVRIMHACEKGATGVYWGHRLVASFLYRDLLAPLGDMHAHEVAHYALFAQVIEARRSRTVFVPVLWCAGGILYGVMTALLGRRAIWKSTAVIEAIVVREITWVQAHCKGLDGHLDHVIQRVLQDEVAHQETAASQLPGVSRIDAVIIAVARMGAALSKRLAQKW